MIAGQADPILDPARLERAVAGFRREVAAAPRWFFREKYVDRGPLDPFYILDYRAESEVEDAGDDLMGEPLFATAVPGMTVKRMTREPEGHGGSYWRPIEAGDLIYRLDRFLTMYREDYLQPPGYRGGLQEPDNLHPRFEKKKFVYRVGRGDSALVGTGSRMFAGQEPCGAIRGRLVDEAGRSLEGVEVVLTSGTQTLRCTSATEGRFWFSRVAPGKATLGLAGRAAQVQRSVQEEFGNVRGWVANSNGWPLQGVEVTLEAPDGELLRELADASGKLSTRPLPAFPYLLRLPQRRFHIATESRRDAVIGGTLRDSRRKVLAGEPVVLMRRGEVVARVVTDTKGSFRFDNLAGGCYSLQLPGRRISVRRAPGAEIRGRIHGLVEPVWIELFSSTGHAALERPTATGKFHISTVLPAIYEVRVKRDQPS